MLGRLLKRWSVKNMDKSLAKYEDFLSIGTPSELGGILAASSLARVTVIRRPPLGREFPQDELDGIAISTPVSRSALAIYNMSLITTLKQCQSETDPARIVYAELLASGLTVWIMSIRSLQAPELLSKGRRIWDHLLKGKSEWPEQLSIMLNKQLKSEDVESYWYVPAFLVSNDLIRTPPIQAGGRA